MAVGVLYSKGLRFRKRRFRLKAGYGIKNLVAGISWGASIALSLPTPELVIFAFFTIKLFVNSAFFDLKDVEKDDIRTLPMVFGRAFKPFLLIANALLHLLAYVQCWNVVLLFSFAFSQFGIFLGNKAGRAIIDLESTLSVLLYSLCPKISLCG